MEQLLVIFDKTDEEDFEFLTLTQKVNMNL